MAAQIAQALFAANRPEGRWANGPSMRSANTVSTDGASYAVYRTALIPGHQTYEAWQRETVVIPFGMWILPALGGVSGPQSTLSCGG